MLLIPVYYLFFTYQLYLKIKDMKIWQQALTQKMTFNQSYSKDSDSSEAPAFLRCFKLPVSWRRKGRPTPGFLPGKSHGQRSLVGYSPWSHKIRHNLATEQQQWGIQQNEEEPLLQLMWAVSHLRPGRQESQTPGLGPLNFVTCWTVGDFLSRSPLCSIPVFT